MITYEFTAAKMPLKERIFTAIREEEEKLAGMIMVPLELRVPKSEWNSEGVGPLQTRITTAVDKMVAELNEEN